MRWLKQCWRRLFTHRHEYVVTFSEPPAKDQPIHIEYEVTQGVLPPKIIDLNKIELTEEDLAIVGHAPIEAELEHNGKLYKGTLDFVKEVSK